jgi:hypothetical protein
VKRQSFIMSVFMMVVFCAALFSDDTLPGLKPDRFSLSGYGSFVVYQHRAQPRAEPEAG